MSRRSLAIILLLTGCSDGAIGNHPGDSGTHDAPPFNQDGGPSSGADAPIAGPDALVPVHCGDGTRELGEECDDGNTTAGDGCDSSCIVEAAPGASAQSAAALHAINAIRAKANVRGISESPALDAASLAHANYYVNNAAAYSGGLSPHNEDMTYPMGFTGVNFWDRDTAAGFTGSAMFEVMAFSDDPTSAVPQWLNTVLHRVPILHPNAAQTGYGGASAMGRAADVDDFGSGPSEDPNQIVLWPPPGAIDAVGSFAGNEGPMPPAPPGGSFPSGPIISILFDNSATVTITAHELRDSGGNLLTTTWITPSDPSVGAFMMGSYAMYAAGPAASGATFSVHLTGTINGTAFTRDWSFTVL
jgi:cysteine-rich repeat protein